MKPLLRLGTRGSPLALWQANWVAEAILDARPELDCDLVKVRTLAEKFPDKDIPDMGTGVFTKELDEALLRGDVELAVHSLKDVPTELHPELVIAAVPERESPLDAFLSSNGTRLQDLPWGARLGTGSPRRKAQILNLRPDLGIVPLRGNVATRLRKVGELGLAGTILAHAGLRRLQEEECITQILEPEILVPAVSQGALGIIAAAGNKEVIDLLREVLDHAVTRRCVTAERAFLRRLRGGCQVPAGALATVGEDGALHLRGVVAAPDGSACIRGEVNGGPGREEALGSELADELLARGGAQILRSLRGD